jgi:Uma2 family endonuclease
MLNDTPLVLAPFPVQRFTVEQYRRLGEAGVLKPSDRVELLEGWIVPKMNHNPLHDGTIELVDNALRSLLPEGWRLRIQSAITTSDSEPEPDLAIVRGPAGRYLQTHPTAADIALVIEVADSSLSLDRLKSRLYAREGIVCYWIVNLVDRKIEVYSEPSGKDENPQYRVRKDFSINDRLPLSIAGNEAITIEAANIIPAGTLR